MGIDSENKYIVSAQRTIQVSEDSWMRQTKTLIAGTGVSIERIEKWCNDNSLEFDTVRITLSEKLQ